MFSSEETPAGFVTQRIAIACPDHEPPPTPKNELNRSPTVVMRSVWEATDLAVLQMRDGEESAEYEDFGPELPFTD
jgi:hypothetical protein